MDYFIITLILSIVTIGFKPNTALTEKANELITDYQKGDITLNEYQEEVYQLNYDLQKSNININIVNIVLYVGYFMVFACLNKGQTLGKKLFKIKVVNKNDETPSIWNMIVRSLFIYGIISLLYSTITINFLGVKAFANSYMIVNYVDTFLLIVAFFMVIYKKDGRGLHDVIAGTKVVESR